MALQTARPRQGFFGIPTHGSLLLLLLSLGWVLASTAQAADTGLGVMTPWLQRTSQDLSWQRPELTVILPRARRDTEKKACPPGRKAQVVDENLVFYEEWELEACVDGALLAAQMDRVNLVPFTYQQLNIFKRKLDKFYPQGYPESLIQRLRYFFLWVTPEDIHKWNVTSLETVKSLLKVSKGNRMDAQVTALIARYVGGGGQLDKATLDALASFHPTYLCFLSPEQLGSVQLSVVWATRPQDLDACSLQQMTVLYPKARTAFQNVSGSEYFTRIKPYLGGAPTEDLRALSRQNINMDVATFKKLRTEAVLPLTIAEVQKLLGTNLMGLKAEEANSPLREWISRQSQEDLDSLGLGLHGGTPNGYLVLDFSVREASSGGPLLLRLGPGPVLTVILSLLLALILN
ncbi:mesothelin isoform X1 [Hippopotamus amphibius kiboko]|uniref:mesothelin isoform X1 n=1 Tax=Hippopotamus amphibius kiboko TaxID=575201 RepID=UPI002594784F|nr:mesothelin isoform X1 [Hippopotamus amphibius kiboko]XP_057603877.1 mesothelin isoform X1 [Hippopotamus amphibius kiboko]XP_057603878.1 mesothelin isoform X1 [Hippopotamus amphibius kiboko]XP_057603879.1 mesothelin isoform X1 [Hippopotamus amphibius kiboko]